MSLFNVRLIQLWSKTGTDRRTHTDKWNRMGNPEIDSHKYAQLIFEKGAKAIQQRNDSLSTNGIRVTEHTSSLRSKMES